MAAPSPPFRCRSRSWKTLSVTRCFNAAHAVSRSRARVRDLIGNARRIVALLDETAAALRAAPLDGPVRIGVPEEYGVPVLSKALAAFSRQHPRVEITVRFATSHSQVAALNTGDLDLAVVFEWEDFTDSEILMADPSVWVTSASSHRHEERPLPIALYQNSNWCRDYALKSLDRRGIDHRVAYLSDTSGGMRLAATSGLAVAPIARSNIPAGCRELTVADGSARSMQRAWCCAAIPLR